MSVAVHTTEFGRAYRMEDVRRGLGEQDWQQYQLIPPAVEYAVHDSFETSDAEGYYFGESFDVSQADHVTRKQEVWLLRRYQYAQYRLGLLIEDKFEAVFSAWLVGKLGLEGG